MRLLDVARAMREHAHGTYERGEVGDQPQDRRSWQAALIDYGYTKLSEYGLIEQAARAWLAHLARDVTADLIKPTGRSPRVPAGQMKAWPDLAPTVGRAEMRRWASKYRHVAAEYQLVLRVLGTLDVFFGDDEAAFIGYDTLAEACFAAGVDRKDVEALAA